MPGYVIHLAVAEEYLRKHKEKNESYNDFIEGVIFPDSVRDKSLTHYGERSSNVNLYRFLQDKRIDTSFNRGYFLHLLTDYLFYNEYIDSFSKELYNDYDRLNEKLINEFNVKLPEKIKEFVFYKNDGECKILNLKIAKRFIEDISELDLDEIEKDVIANSDKWTKIRPLKNIN